ncbi:MAG: penicillin-binding protein 1C, partial [Myxococcales bacterium]
MTTSAARRAPALAALRALAGAARRARLPLAAGAALALTLAVLWWRLPASTWVDRARFVRYRDARTVTDRHGTPLRLVRADGMDRRWVALRDVSPTLVDAVLAAEDVRFRQHAGVDARAVLRAAVVNLVPGRPRSGASTITQQLVKLVYGRPSGLASKLGEIVRAAALERLMTKDEILEQYLNRVPFGDRIEGVARASEAYLGHPVAQLSVAEAALLAGVPQAPSLTEPRRHLPRALRRRARVLDRMHAAGLIDDRALASALAAAPRILAAPPHPDEASRFVDRILTLDAAPDARRPGPALRTSLDLDLQHAAERTLLAAVDRLSTRGVTNGA